MRQISEKTRSSAKSGMSESKVQAAATQSIELCTVIPRQPQCARNSGVFLVVMLVLYPLKV
jgi:precorrin-6x reductase